MTMRMQLMRSASNTPLKMAARGEVLLEELLEFFVDE